MKNTAPGGAALIRLETLPDVGGDPQPVLHELLRVLEITLTNSSRQAINAPPRCRKRAFGTRKKLSVLKGETELFLRTPKRTKVKHYTNTVWGCYSGAINPLAQLRLVPWSSHIVLLKVLGMVR